MVAIELQFLAGRYHATPWGRHVNEGVPEWPPSPWRLLRALASVWKTQAPEVPDEEVAALLEALADPPEFWLPDSRTGHTRHYMPTRDPAAPSLVFDTFRVVGRRGKLQVVWRSARLSERQRALLGRLVGGLSYLGRAESWVEARMVDGEPRTNCVPMADEDDEATEDFEVVRVLAPAKPLDLELLMAETADLRRRRLLTPPGSRWVRYRLPRFSQSQPSAERELLAVLASQRLSVARYLLQAKLLPPVTQTVMVGHSARRAAMSWYGRTEGGESSSTLSGKKDGKPLQGHRHAFYLATDEDEDGKLDHLTIWAREGFSREELQALASIPELKWGSSDDTRLRLTLLGFGDDVLARRMAPRLFGPSRRWLSFSPFVLVRHVKLRKEVVAGQERMRVVESPEDQVRRELQNHGYDPTGVEVKSLGRGTHHWVQFRRRRPSGPPPVGGAYGFELTFPVEVTGPMALGYGCHFGLGLFLAEPTK